MNAGGGVPTIGVNAGGATDPFLREVPISALEHWSYCPRQCGLIHVEQTYEENLYTLVGKLAHERVDVVGTRAERGISVVRGLEVWSDAIGLRGRADVVEFGRDGVPYPVEYKSGRAPSVHARVQLAAQALCLEEMFATVVSEGAIYTVATRRRHRVEIDLALRRITMEMVGAVRAMLETDQIPPAVADARCRRCSLVHACMPAVLASPARVRALEASTYWPLAEPDVGDRADWFGVRPRDPAGADGDMSLRDWLEDGTDDLPSWGTALPESEDER